MRANNARWYAANRDQVAERHRQAREADPAAHAAKFKAWADANGPYFAAKENRKRAMRLQSTPAWLSPIQLAQIQEFYEIAHAKRLQTGKKFHVDHIVPLNGQTFRGLHVPWNLQILGAAENVAKKNRAPKDLAHLFWETA